MDQIHTPKKTCEMCKTVLHGRSDQRFCNDTCRNSFNRIKREMEKVSLPSEAVEIIKIIKRNYQILKSEIPGQVIDKYGTIQCNADTIVKNGLNLKYFTSSFGGGEDKWYCVFDRCYCIKGEIVFIIDVRDQLNIK